ncbi:hypothetical protein D7030_13520 [Flavobacteriaceae bacterium AU392]|nr:hypothetical protein D1817_04970 [Flavobacteriaceae bacterium]RKM81321.1 hypothetical protein D7030_13520 [Flavobacteriaceae bacterium AU392]
MLKRLIILTIVTFQFNYIYSNQIDNLNNTEEVLQFVKSFNKDFINDKYAEFQIRSTKEISKDLNCGGLFNKWSIKNWEKIDLNNDNLTDLIVIGYLYDYFTIAIIDKNQGDYKIHRINKNPFEKCELVKPIKVEGENQLKIFHKKYTQTGLFEFDSKNLIDTLSFKYDDILELNDVLENYNIKSIQLKTSYCFGSCPVFTLKMYKNGNVEYKGEEYVDYKGEYKTKFPIKRFNTLAAILNYIRVKELKDTYAVTWTDDQTAFLEIEFKNGEVKKIKDYGLQGTYGLRTIYNKMIEIGTKTKWKK